MSVAFLERSIQLINGKIIQLKNYTNATILSAVNQMSSAISIVASSVSAIDVRLTSLEGSAAPTTATTTTSLSFSAVHSIDEASIWTDGADGTIVRLLGNNTTFNTLLLPAATAGQYYVLTNTATTGNHHIDINEGSTTKYTLQPLETATLVKTSDDWVGVMGIVPKVATVLSA